MKCSQCDKPAFGNSGLCVEYYLMAQQATYLHVYMLSKQLNYLTDELEAEDGGLVKFPHIEMAPPPFIGNNLTLNNINVTKSTLGAINTGTIQNLDAGITLMQSSGESEIAKAVQQLSQAIVDSNEINASLKNEIAEQLEFLTAQILVEKQKRSIGTVRSVLSGIRDVISISAGLLMIWDKVEPLFRAAFGI
jgi:hypothetical protein